MSTNQSGIFSIRSLQKINEQLRNCQRDDVRLILLARKAGTLARHSYLVEAQELVNELRPKNLGFDPQLSGWILLAEGLIEHFANLNNAKAKDKFNRAFLVSQIANERELAGTCAAWIAHCEFVSGRISATGNHILKAFEWSEADEGEARARGSMVVADAFNAIEDLESARQWFRRARNHAVREGDIAMQNVMLFNISAYGVGHLNLDDCISSVNSAEVRRIAMEVSSAANLNSALGGSSLSSLVPILQAELYVVQREWATAISSFDRHLPTFVLEGQSRLLPRIIAQRAWCNANIRDFAAARSDITTSIESVKNCIDQDDLAVLYFRLSGAADLLGSSEEKTYYRNLAEDHLTRFRTHQAEISAMLQSVIEKIDPQTKNPA